MHIFGVGKIRRRQVYLFARFHFGAVWTLSLVELRTKMRMGVLPLLPQSSGKHFDLGTDAASIVREAAQHQSY